MNIHSHVQNATTSDSSPIRDKRAAIVAAACELMGDASFGGTPVPAVAERAGVAIGTLYRYFPGKDALANAVYREAKLAMQGFLHQARAGAGSARDAFGRLWRGLFAFAREQPAAFRFLELHRHQAYLDEASQVVARRVFADVAEFVRAAQARGAVRAEAPELLIALAFGAFVGLMKEAEAGHVRLDADAIEHAEASVWRLFQPGSTQEDPR
jgi:AcrR family transcriptional regulator